jgi:hypothetical protein
MTIQEVCQALQGAPHLVAARPRGLAIQMTDRGRLIRIAVVRPYRWTPMISDLLAIDWRVFTREQYGQILKAAADKEAAEEADKENGDD